MTSFAHLVNRGPARARTSSRRPRYRDLADAQAILVVNSNLDEEHFVVDLHRQAGDPQRRQADLHRPGREPHRRGSPRSSCSAGRRRRRLVVLGARSRRPRGWRARTRGRPAGPGRRWRGLDARGGRATRPASTRRRSREAAQVLVGEHPQGARLQPRLPRARGTRATRGCSRRSAPALGCGAAAAAREGEHAGAARHGREPRRGSPATGPMTTRRRSTTLEKEWCVVAARPRHRPAATSRELLRREEDQGRGRARRGPARQRRALPAAIREGLLGGRVPRGRPTSSSPTTARGGQRRAAAEQHGRDRGHLHQLGAPRAAGARGPSRRGPASRPGRSCASSRAQMGYRFKMKYDGPAEVLRGDPPRRADLPRRRRSAARTAIRSGTPSRSPLTPAPVNGAATAPVVTPIRTAALDFLDARFERWFEGLFNAAEKQRAPAV